MEPSPRASFLQQFRAHWKTSTVDDNVTLYGFRRFKTTHLLNLRFLESEIAQIDHAIYQAGLNSGVRPTPRDRLGLKSSIRDEHVSDPSTLIDRNLILKLRSLLMEYGECHRTKLTNELHASKPRCTDARPNNGSDEALQAFNQIMSMETSSLIDDPEQARQRTDLSLHEIYKTRMLRVDLGQRLRQDPVQRFVRKCIYGMRFRQLSRELGNDAGAVEAQDASGGKACLSTVLLAEILARLLMAALIAVFVVVPLATLSYQPSKGLQLAVISICVVVFACLISVLLKVTSLEMMMVSTAYGAILTVFISNVES
ncbi:hypothetical protein CGCTS75_v001428 [Colletotrichum tropicale]|nr:hypothetical protein CGCTS75_v001428 [Colletotrichum tropicale]